MLFAENTLSRFRKHIYTYTHTHTLSIFYLFWLLHKIYCYVVSFENKIDLDNHCYYQITCVKIRCNRICINETCGSNLYKSQLLWFASVGLCEDLAVRGPNSNCLSMLQALRLGESDALGISSNYTMIYEACEQLCPLVIKLELAFSSFLEGGTPMRYGGKDPPFEIFRLRSEPLFHFFVANWSGTIHLDSQPQFLYVENHDENNVCTSAVVCGALTDNFCVIGKTALWLWENLSQNIWVHIPYLYLVAVSFWAL